MRPPTALLTALMTASPKSTKRWRQRWPLLTEIPSRCRSEWPRPPLTLTANEGVCAKLWLTGASPANRAAARVSTDRERGVCEVVCIYKLVWVYFVFNLLFLKKLLISSTNSINFSELN